MKLWETLDDIYENSKEKASDINVVDVESIPLEDDMNAVLPNF